MAISKNKNAQYSYHYLIDKYGYSPAQAAGIVGNLMQESTFNTGARNKGDGRDGSDSIGIGQWNQGRAKNLFRYADSTGRDPYSLDVQLDFVHHELNGAEKRSGDMLRNAQDIPSATAAMISFERPAGFKWDNPTAGHGYKNRERYAADAVRSFGGDDGAQVLAGYQPSKTAAPQASQNTHQMAAADATPTPRPVPEGVDSRMLDKDGKELTGLKGFGRGIRNGIDDFLGVKTDKDGVRSLGGFTLDGPDSDLGNLAGFASAMASASQANEAPIQPLQGGRLGGSSAPVELQFASSVLNNQEEDDDLRKRRGGLSGFGGFRRIA